MKIPTNPEALTAEWLTRALCETATVHCVQISSVRPQATEEGKGIVGQLARLRLEYDPAEEDAPQSVIAKFSGIAHKREARFYQVVAPQIELRTPRCFYSHIDLSAEKYVLLLEDLEHARNGSRVVGCSRQDAEIAIRQIAKFHAMWWEDPQLAGFDWLPDFVHDISAIQEIYPDLWKLFLEKVDYALPGGILEVGEKMADNLAYVVNQLFQTKPRTLVHGDYQFDNLFFGRSQDDAPLTVIDWQFATRGRGVTDVAYLIGEGLSVKDRRAYELDLLRIYHTTLVENGVREYSFDQCLADYRLFMLGRMVGIVLTVTRSEYADEVKMMHINTLFPRNSAAILDLSAGELLPS